MDAVHRIHQRCGVIQIDARTNAARSYGMQVYRFSLLAANLAPREAFAQGVFDDRSQRHPRFGRLPLRVLQKSLVEPDRGSHASNHMMYASICQGRAQRHMMLFGTPPKKNGRRLIQAFVAGESADAVPMDQVLVTAGETPPVLMLAQGKYRFAVQD